MAAIQRKQIWTYPPYSPDLILSYSYLSPKMRRELLDSSGEVTAAVDYILEVQDAILKASICHDEHWTGCVNVNLSVTSPI